MNRSFHSASECAVSKDRDTKQISSYNYSPPGMNRSRRDKKKTGVSEAYKEEGGARCSTVMIAHLNP